MKNWIIILLLCLGTQLSASQQLIYPLDTLYPVHSLETHLQILPDTGKIYTPSQILSDTSLTYFPRSDFGRFLDIETVYWGKVLIRSNGVLKNWKLHLEDKYFGANSWIIGNGKVDVYAFVNNELLFHKKSGTAYSASEKEIPEPYNLNRISLDLPANQLLTLLIRVEGNNEGCPPFFNAHIRQGSYDHYHPYREGHNFFNTFLLGVCFIIFIYHLLQFIYLRQSIFFWFSLWVGNCMITQAMLDSYFSELVFSSFHNTRFIIWNFIANGILFTFWFFGRSFINSKQKFPKIDKAILVLTTLIFLEIICNTAYQVFWDPVIRFGAMGIHYELIALFSILGLGLAVIICFQKDRFAKYFGFGAILANSALLLGSLWSMRFIQLNFDPYALGIFLQVIAYSFGIAYRQQQITLAAQQEKLLAEQSKAEAQRIKDLDEIKTRFFANISHEFRTPLALISGLIQRAYNKGTSDHASNKSNAITLSHTDFAVVQNNSKRLESLIDQLLDLSRLENGHVYLQLRRDSLVKFIRSVVFSFESLAERQNISLNTTFPPEIDHAFYDRDKLEKILSNLLSNAFKYTPEGGAVTFTMKHDDSYFIFEVSDTGKGISNKNIHKIFDRFYRVEGTEEKGSGIGLALTKELVNLHNGQISVSSTKGEGTNFKVRIPYTLPNLPESTIHQTNIESAESLIDLKSSQKEQSPIIENNSIPAASSQNLNLPTALLVEDNADLRQFIRDSLNGHFKVIIAIDGEQGERMAFEHIPDIIVSDVMMPKKDGYELSHSLKTNSKTSHIPIIMLTAKAGKSNRVEGLTQGVEAYLTKPFDEDELLLLMRNLVDSRKRMWEQFKASDFALVKNIEVQSLDDQFLQNVVSVIKEQIDNEQLSVEDLARCVGFSRSQLHRKLKALTNLSANQMITDIRLNEARRMLQLKQGSVSEIAYSVGYSNMSYFTKSFKAKFGVLPSRV